MINAKISVFEVVGAVLIPLFLIAGPIFATAPSVHAESGPDQNNDFLAASLPPCTSPSGNCVIQNIKFLEDSSFTQRDQCSAPTCSSSSSISIGAQASQSLSTFCGEESSCTANMLQTLEVDDNTRQENLCNKSNTICDSHNSLFEEQNMDYSTAASNECSGASSSCNIMSDVSGEQNIIVDQLNNCSGSQSCQNSVSQQASESVFNTLINDCENTNCSNAQEQHGNQISVSNAENKCSGPITRVCTNIGNQVSVIFTGAELENTCTNSLKCENAVSQLTTSNQVQDQQNDCNNADCTNNATQVASVENDASLINNCSDQEVSVCSGSANQVKAVNQESNQINRCFESICKNSVLDDAALLSTGTSSKQKSVQNSLCLDESNCQNQGVLQSTDESPEEDVSQALLQQNLCLHNAICNNNGEVVGASGSNTQSNTCIGGASCSNSGTDNKNICTNGATCTNAGTNTKLISNGDPCAPKTDDSVTICSNGRIITRPS